MTINREKLIKLLVERTRMTKADVERHLADLTERILDAAERGKALEIKDFGLFYFDDNNDLSFKAADKLDKEINFEYAGMEPVEIKPPQRKPVDAPDTDDSDDTNEIETAAGSPEEDSAHEDDIFGIKEALKGNTEQLDLSDEDEDEDDDFDSDSFAKIFEGPAADNESEEPQPAHKAGTAPAGKTPPKKRRKTPAKKKKPSGGAIPKALLGVVGVIILVLGYFLISQYLSAPEPTANENNQVEELDDPAVTAQQDITETGEPAAENDVEVSDSDEITPVPEEDSPLPAESETNADSQDGDDTEEAASAQTQNRYGLLGEYVEAGGREYTIVLHSLSTRQQAENAARDLSADGYRTIISESTVNNQNVFRVGVGQFESVASAMSEAETLPDPFNTQNFIQRIQ
ncbi:MAG: hypothetical protein GVY08_05465 [Bacteroidetes bacterium]|jgi:nucleoid DNA-binding protein/cell division septation protein DedD|nr:hypothetical protein [Bacteroidota bacterium]